MATPVSASSSQIKETPRNPANPANPTRPANPTSPANATNSTNPVTPSASQTPINDEAANKDGKEHPKMKCIHTSFMIVALAILFVICAAVLGLHLSQSTIDSRGKEVFEQHKSKTVDSAAKSTRVVQTFPNLVTDAAYSGLSTKMFENVTKELDIADIKQIERREVSDIVFVSFDSVANEVKKACKPQGFVITNKTEYVEMLNKAIDVYNEQAQNITQPIDDAKSEFNDLTMNESRKTGRLSKTNFVDYSGGFTTMMNSYQTSIITKDDYYIKSFNNQIDLQKSSKSLHLIFIIVSISIGIVLYGVEVGTFIGFTKGWISPDTYKRISTIIIGIGGILLVGYVVFAALGSIGISPFAYQCELKAESQKSDSKFHNFNGEAANLGSIADGCEKGQTVYSKMSPYLDKNKIESNLNSYKTDVSQFATILPKLEFEKHVHISDQMAILKKQKDEYALYKTKCLESKVGRYVDDIVDVLQNLHDSLQNSTNLIINVHTKLTSLPSRLDPFIKNSFAALRNVTGDVVVSINTQLKSTDFSCHFEKPPALCVEYDSNRMKVTLSNWLICIEFLLLFGLAILLRRFAKKMMREVDEINAQFNAANEQLKKLTEDNRNFREMVHERDAEIYDLEEIIKNKQILLDELKVLTEARRIAVMNGEVENQYLVRDIADKERELEVLRQQERQARLARTRPGVNNRPNLNAL